MNGTVKMLLERKSVRVYTEEPITDTEKQLILKAAIEAPTAGNMTLYTVLDITDGEIRKKLSVTCDNQPFIAEAPMVLIFCADCRRWFECFKRHVDDVRQPDMGDLFLAQADAFIAAQSAVTAGESLGIGSCYIGDITENFETHRELLKLPKYVVPTCMVCFGHPTAQQLERKKPPRFKIEDIVFENAYDKTRSDAMDDMLTGRGDFPADGFSDRVRRFCERKWNSAFSREMSRSCRAIAAAWCEKE